MVRHVALAEMIGAENAAPAAPVSTPMGVIGTELHYYFGKSKLWPHYMHEDSQILYLNR